MSGLAGNCIICGKINSKNDSIAITHRMMPNTQPELTFYTFLQSISNFNRLDMKNVHQRVCTRCYEAAVPVLNFQEKCKRAADTSIQLLTTHKTVTHSHCLICNVNHGCNMTVESVSNFKKINIGKVSAKTCDKCYQAALPLLNFQILCNKAIVQCNGYLNVNVKENIKKEETQNSFEPAADNESHKKDQETLPNVEFPEDDFYRNEDSDFLKAKARTDAHKAMKSQAKRERVSKWGSAKEQCKFCGKFLSRFHMPNHKRIHTGEKPFKCNLCDKSFGNHGTYWMHKKSHVGKRFLCTICGTGFMLKIRFTDHMKKKHSDEQPFTCEVCGKSFATQESLKTHVATHSNTRPFACPKCPKAFKTNKHLTTHLVTHMEIKPIVCEFCGKRFTQAHARRSHLAKSCKGSNANEISDIAS